MDASSNDHCPDAMHSLSGQKQCHQQQQAQVNAQWDCLINSGQIEKCY